MTPLYKLIFTTFAAGAFCLGAYAQTYRLPGQHESQSADLLANQEHLTDQINLSVENYIDFAEEEEPEMDIYTEGWDSKRVNCYSEADVPSSAVINVTNFAMPHPGYVTSPYGYRKRFRRMHKGIDLKVNIGDTIRSAFDGRVRILNFERSGYGNYVVVRHTNDMETVYGHLSAFLVKEGDYVKAGDPIALGGNTGRSTGAHLHFETRYMGYAINPAGIFDFANQTTHTDEYAFSKKTYTEARNFDPKANAEYQKAYLALHPNKPSPRNNVSALPGARKTTATASSGSSVYVVKKGDSLSRIASRNGTTVAQLCKLNGLKTTSKLQIGQKLKLR